MKTYKLKLTALTPIHIGTGESYEPTNYVIDGGFLYEFDEMLFVQSLSQSLKNQFSMIASSESENGYELFEKVHRFIIDNKENAKKVAYNKIPVSWAVEQKYKKDIAKKVQIEGKNKNTHSVFNKFEIQKTQRLLNNVSTFLSGSSIKGSISTAYQEFIFKKYGKQKLENLFDKDKLFKNLSISDTLAQNSKSQIGYAINKEIFETDDNAEISTFIEVNSTDSEYLIDLTIKDFQNADGLDIAEKITKEKIIEACNAHYKILYDEKESKKLNLKPNQFLLSVGKHSGARAVTIDGMRKILVKLAQIQNKREEGDDSEKRVERLYKKSHFENDNIKEMFAKYELLSDDKKLKEKENWQNAKDFIETPSRLENLVRNRKSLTINAILTQETTYWQFSESKDSNHLHSFGWVLCEFIDEDEYRSKFKEFKSIELDLIEERVLRQKEIIDRLNEVKFKAEQERIAKEQKKLQEQKEAEEKVKLEQERLSSLSPLELKLDELSIQNKSMPKTTLILQNIKNGKLDEFRDEALKLLEKLMKENKEWKEKPTGKKPEKDKEYQKTLEVKKLVGLK
ncbi:MAG: RAMP superfamily CRISPR-associated protein [Sulfurovum sp.]|nr:RAMP superfamily CRISPR-associated protein [Sulfurovum sp.]